MFFRNFVMRPSHAWISRGVPRGLVMAACVALVTGCHGLLDTTDPTLVRDQDIANPSGANGRRLNAMVTWSNNVRNVSWDVALFTDEMAYDAPASADMNADWALDLRSRPDWDVYRSDADEHLRMLTSDVANTALAIGALRAYGDPATKHEYLAQMFAVRGSSILQIAEDICPGFPINDLQTSGRPIYSGPYTTDSAARYAVQTLDSALANVHDSTRFANLAQVIKGRALLDLGQYTEAMNAVSTVPTSFQYGNDPQQGNRFYLNGAVGYTGSYYYIVGDRDGTNGLAFVSEHDNVRVPSVPIGGHFNDPATQEYVSPKYQSASQPVLVATGIEARLIEAESRYNLDPSSTAWYTTLNTLRTDAGIAPLAAMPSTDTGKVNLIYHERAFWLYGTGRRLGDLRRLIRNYGRGAETVFPTGVSAIPGKQYGTMTAIPFRLSIQGKVNPNIHQECAVQ